MVRSKGILFTDLNLILKTHDYSEIKFISPVFHSSKKQISHSQSSFYTKTEQKTESVDSKKQNSSLITKNL